MSTPSLPCWNRVLTPLAAWLVTASLAVALPFPQSGANQEAQHRNPVAARFLDGGIDAVGWIDVDAIGGSELERLLDLLAGSIGNDHRSAIATLREARVRRVTWFVSLAGLLQFQDGFWCAFEAEAPQSALQILQPGLLKDLAVRVDDGLILAGVSQDGFQSLLQREREPREELRQALARCRGPHALAFAPDQKTMRMAAAMAGGPHPDQEPETARLFESLASLRSLACWSDPENGTISGGLQFPDEPSAAQFATVANRALEQLMPPDGAAAQLIAHGSEVQLAEPARLAVRLISRMQQQARDAAALNNFRQIAIAVHNFESAHQTLPPQALVDERGKKLLSWRVLLLPYLGEQELYEQFRLDEPWDSPHNIKLLDRMPAAFAMADPDKAREQKAKGLTRVVAPLSADSLFGMKGLPPRFADIRDGTSNTLLIVEAAPGRAVPWTAPQDLALEGEDPLALLGNRESGEFLGARVDGSVSAFPLAMPVKVLRALLSIQGGEVIDQINWQLR